MPTKKNTSGKKTVLRVTPVFWGISLAIALVLGLVIGLFLPTPGNSIPSTPLSKVKVTELTVNALTADDPVTLRFKLNGLPEDTQLVLLLKQGDETKQMDCTLDGSFYGCTIPGLTEKNTHVTLVLVHKGTSFHLPLVRNLSRAGASIGYLGVWEYQ